MLLWEIVTWGDSPYKNVVSLDALLELIQVGAFSEGFDTDYHCALLRMGTEWPDQSTVHGNYTSS